MRLLLTSLVAGGCVLAGATVATADELRLDDAALDNVSAGVFQLAERRSALLAYASYQIALGIVTQYNNNPDPSALPLVSQLVFPLDAFSQQQAAGAGDFLVDGYPPILPLPPLAMPPE